MNGCSIVRRRGQTVLLEVDGVADPATKEPVSAESRFQIASISKGFTAAAILRLFDVGSLSLDETIDRWFAGPPVWSEITVHQLLNHTSGLGHWEDYDIELTVPMAASAEIERFTTRHLFPPGTGWAYSSPGYVLLARIVERVSGWPYQEFLTAEVIERAGLADSFVGNANGRANVTQPLIDGTPVESFELDVVSVGAGDVWCTPADLAAWTECAVSGRLFSPEIGTLPFATPVPVPDSDRAYGYGWVIGPFAGRPAILHQGGNRGFRAITLWFPDDELSVSVLSNEGTTNPDAKAEALLDLVRDL